MGRTINHAFFYGLDSDKPCVFLPIRARAGSYLYYNSWLSISRCWNESKFKLTEAYHYETLDMNNSDVQFPFVVRLWQSSALGNEWYADRES